MLRTRILTASVLGLLLLLVLFVFPPDWAVGVFAGAMILGAWEWSGFGSLRGPVARSIYAAVMAVLLAAGWVWTRDPVHLGWLLSLACAWWVVAFIWLSVAPASNRPALILLCGVPVLVPTFVALARVHVSPRGFARGPEMLLWMLLLVFAADIGAYFAGRAWGRHKLAPQVSPGKTWEGAIGGLAAAALVGLGGALHFGLPVLAGVVFACAIGVFSIIGDLTESMFKRAVGLKDSGRLLPGHGGVLDRVDSVTAAAPLYALGLFGSGVIE
jgi:phosphatidate cytidylyltransferase